MAIKTIMSVCTAKAPDADIKMVAGLCEEASAHLSLVIAGIAISPPIGEFAISLSETWMEERDADLKAIGKRFETAARLLDAYGISYDIDTEYAEAAWTDTAVGLHAHYADLVVLGHSVLKSDLAAPPVLEGAIFRSARPVLLVPEGGVRTLMPRNVLIAWNSKQEAARAVFDGLELLKHADNVSIAMVDPVASSRKSGEEPGADLAAYLVRHGAKVTVERLASCGKDTADVLKQHAMDIGAEMIVMGAYGHSRLRERVFGGVTRAFIDGAAVPILMAH